MTSPNDRDRSRSQEPECATRLTHSGTEVTRLAARLVVVALLAAIGVVPLGCEEEPRGKADTSDDGTCERDGETWLVGDAGYVDSCTFCDCSAPGELSCSNHCTCVYEGVLYGADDTFPAVDGCNTCECGVNGMVHCTEEACASCTVEGVVHPPNTPFTVGACNTCSCIDVGLLEGVATCEASLCEPLCTYRGLGYLVGESFAALDGCNTCACEAGGDVACSEEACACDPSREWYRDYVHSPPGLDCVGFMGPCPPGSASFGNDCGCGCEQDPACPEWFDCSGSEPCDTAALQEACPYSKIAS